MSQPFSLAAASAAASASASSVESAGLQGMEDEPQDQTASAEAAAASSSSAAAAAPSWASSSLLAAAPIAAAAAAASSAASGPSVPASLRVARRRPAKLKSTTMSDFFKPVVQRVESWSLRKQQARAREDNAADRAALALESGRLNELRNCFQLGNERLNLPYLPTELLRVIAAYAERVSEPDGGKRGVVAGVVVSRVLFNPFRHVVLEFDSEAAFRAYAVDVVIVQNQLREYKAGRQAAWEEAEMEREAERGFAPDLRTAEQISADQTECDEDFLERFADDMPTIHDFVERTGEPTERHAQLEKMLGIADPRTPVTEIARLLTEEEYGQPEDTDVRVNIIYAPSGKA